MDTAFGYYSYYITSGVFCLIYSLMCLRVWNSLWHIIGAQQTFVEYIIHEGGNTSKLNKEEVPLQWQHFCNLLGKQWDVREETEKTEMVNSGGILGNLL